MKIRSIRLTNFRKFVGTVGVEGLNDGVNVLVGRNELGKSTVLAAINGVIFEKARSLTAITKSFRHFVNGTVPEVELVFELEGTRWTIRKRFAGQSGKAWLTNVNGRRFEDEAAETELQRLLGLKSAARGGNEPGIWGTLWVSQGKSFGDAELDESGRGTLQGCIAAQVGVVTGGERGQKIPTAINAALEDISSSKGPRGKFKDAMTELDKTKARVAELETKRREVFEHMDALARHKRERNVHLADYNEERYRSDLEEARARRNSALIKAQEIDTERSKKKHADERAEHSRRAAADRIALVAAINKIQTETVSLSNELAEAENKKNETGLLLDACEKRLAGLRDETRSNSQRLQRLERMRKVVNFQAEIERHEATLAKAAALQSEAGELSESIGRILTTDESVSRIESVESQLAGDRAALNAVATTIHLEIDTAALDRIRLDGAPLSSSSISLPAIDKTVIAIEGIGSVAIAPQIRDRDKIRETLRQSEEEWKTALSDARAESLTEARKAAAQRRELENRLAEIRRQITGLAPKDATVKLVAGLESRETRLRELKGHVTTECRALELSTSPSADDLSKEISEAHATAEQLTADIGSAEAAMEAPKAVMAKATSNVNVLRQQIAAKNAILGTKQASLDAGRNQSSDEKLAADVNDFQRVADEVQTALASLETTQTETVAAIDIRIKRLEAASKIHRDTLEHLNTEIAKTTTWIETNEGDGVEEKLEQERADQARREAAVKAYEEDVRVLQCLQQNLADAKREAEAHYLGPVVNRIQPYLKMLLPGTDIVLDENLSISEIQRNGASEDFNRLSGGTQEQLAILTRLAFAELLLAQGRPATVILDDALAFSDDDRIEQMFDILMRAGQQVQILVLTCRRRLFSRLGATELNLKELAREM